jgi:periplasmic protein TonB
MDSKEKYESESDSRDHAEATLLNFLEKEVDGFKPPQPKKKQPDDLDALMSDLLKQVITETDQPQSDSKASSVTKDDTRRDPVSPEKPAVENKNPQQVESVPAKASAKEPKVEPEKTVTERSVPTKAQPSPPKPVAESPKPVIALPTQTNKTRLIAMAGICLLAVIAIPIYVFKGSSGNASKSAASKPALTAPASAASSNGRVAAIPINKVRPKYPELGTASGPSGDVALELSINEKGEVVQVTPVSGRAIFFTEAIEAAKQWRFRPALEGGNPVPCRTKITLSFRPLK